MALAVAAASLRGADSTPLAPGRISNVSARTTLTAASDSLAVGFVIRGDGEKSVLVRAIGPTLAAFGVPSPLADPTLTLFAGSTERASNDDWFNSASAAQLASLAASSGTFPLGDSARDAALTASLAAGLYTARLAAKPGGNGAAVVEVYDTASASSAQLVNASALAPIGGSAGALTVGFVIGGGLPRRVLIRGAGPSLTALGVSGALSDPQLALFTPGTAAALLRNDNWAGVATLKSAFAAAGAFAFSGDTSGDAALVATLAPGPYTAQLTPVGAASGVGLIEFYDITPAAIAAPAIALQPRSLNVVAGAQASLTVIASSASPMRYQWLKDDVLLAGATNDTLHFDNAQPADNGRYTAIVANGAGDITTSPASVNVDATGATLPPARVFDLVGFATLGSGTTGGGVLLPGDPNYHVIDANTPDKAQQLRTLLESNTPLVVDVQVDVDLGALNNLANRPKTSPELIASGLGVINVRSNKTLFSSTGATLRHGSLSLSGQNNIIVRNLRFRGLWEFDEGSQNPPDNAPWGYKIQDWDYIVAQSNARNIWVDHCDLEKSYDGAIDVKLGADLVTVSWTRLGGDTEGAVERHVAYLEKLYQGELTDSRVTSTFYRGLRDGAYAAQGIPRQSVADIVAHELPHDKTNLIGASDTETVSVGALNVTFHHDYYHACRQRLPRMRFGNAHVFNLYVDNSLIRDGTNIGSASTCDAALFAENSLYAEVADPFPPQSGSSPAGRAAQSGCSWVWHGSETPFPTTFLRDPATWTWNTATKNFTWTVAPAPNARALPYSYTADPVTYTRDNLGYVGVIVPTNAADQAMLASYLVRTTH